MKIRLTENITTVFMVVIVLLIIIPLPTWLLDLAFVLNMAISLIILIMTMNIRSALEFSIFPSVLLVTTLIRIALSISSTKLILQSGYAGNMVKAFGEFVGGNNLVIGFIVFIIIVLVQFIVITKGSERVAEVAARFTLDAMPGKQMAIDADLNAGIIDENTARTRRSNIQREADFYGSMDGATKFVKGDAIMSIILVFVNIIGGVIIGIVMNGGDFASVMQTYTIATIGDGLVSQVPALMISVATGMIVTRAASEESLNIDFGRQFLSQPRTLMIAGGVLAFLGILPGFPTIQLFVIGGGFIFLGVYLSRTQGQLALAEGLAEAPVAAEGSPQGDLEYYRDIDNVYKLLNVEQIEMEFGYSLLPLVDERSGGSLIERVVIFRKQFAVDMGMVIPSVRMRDNAQINPNQYLIKIKGEEVARGEVLVDHYLALDPGGDLPHVDGIETVEPAFGIPARWISEENRMTADIAGYTLIDPTSVMMTHLTEVLKAHAHELLSRQDIKSILEKLKEQNPTVVEDVVPNVVSVAYLQKVLAMLLKEGVPIRDMATILETLGDYAGSVKDVDIVTEYVRQALKRTITHRFAEGGQLRVITLDAELENRIVGSVKKNDQSSYLAMDPDGIQTIVSSLTNQLDKVRDIIPNPIVLTSPVVRVYFKKLIDQFVPHVTVLSFSEIDGNVQIQAIGNIAA